jgi:hypothetical protein
MTGRSFIAANDRASAEALGAAVANALNKPVLWNSQAGYRRSAPVPLGFAIPSPSERNALAMQD